MTKQLSTPRNTRHVFVHSVYITKAWDWLLEFVGRAAEAILVASVLYASVKLLPVVHMPPQLDVVVFIAQFVALDVGGLSLGKLAKQAKAEHNEEGAVQASRMSKALITVMIAGVVVVAVEQLFTIPGNWKIGIDTVLLIARSILAVLYGHIIHSLKAEDEHLSSPPALTQVDEWPLVALAAFLQHQTAQTIETLQNSLQADVQAQLADLASNQKQALDLFRIDQQRLLGKVQDIENSVPEIDYEAIAQAMMPQLRATFQHQARAITEEVQGHVKAIIEENQGQIARPLSGPGPQRQLETRASSQSQQLRPPALTLLPNSGTESESKARANGTPEERLQVAYDLLLKHSIRISGRSLAREAHVSRDTANKWLAEVKGQQEDSDEATIIDTDAEIEAIAQGQ